MSFKIRTDASGNGQFTIDSTDVLSINTNTTVSLPTGTANGVAYLNGSKVLTSGSALTFDGTNLGTGGIAFADASTQSTGGYTGFRNRIINGAMMIDQRNYGASYSAAAANVYYTLDRWAVYSSGAGSTVQQVAGPNTSDKALQIVPTAGNTYQIILQRIESKNCIDLAGQTVTVSGRIYIDNATGAACAINISAATVTDSNYATSMGSFAVTLTSGSYVSFSGQINLTSAAANGIELGIAFSGAAGKTIKLTGVQLEKGSVATPFEFRQYGQELALCQRYCINYTSGAANGPYYRYAYGECVTSSGFSATIAFPVEMRVTPSLTTTSTAGNYGIYSRGILSACTAATILGPDGSSGLAAGIGLTTSGGLTQGSAGAAISNNNNVSYLLFTAEL